MVTLVDKDGPYQLPADWSEVTTRQYCDLDRLKLRTAEARASYFAGRPIQVNGFVADALAWALYDVPTDGLCVYPSDLGQETYLQVETIRSLATAQPMHQCYAEVFATFVARCRGLHLQEFNQAHVPALVAHALDQPVTETYPAVYHCLAELKRLDTKYTALAAPDRTEAGRKAREAGSERLQMFSHFNVAYHYAQKLGRTLEDIYQLAWESVAIMLLHDRTTAEIQDNLNQLHSSKS
jgi:hypothetical protein